MGKWIELFTNHPVHKSLTSLKNLLDSLESPPDQLEYADAVQRLRAFLGHVGGVFQRLNPELVPIGTLNTLNEVVTRINTEITNYRNTKNLAHLTNANSHADTALIALSQIPYPKTRKEAESLSESVRNFRLSAEDIIKSLQDKANSLAKEVEQVSLHSLDADKRIAELNEMVTKQKERIDTIIAEYQRQFSDSQEKRQTSFVNQLTKQTEEFAQLHKELGVKIASFLSQKEADAVARIEFLDKKKKEASDLVQVIGNIGVTGNFNKVANEEKLAADTYRKIALGLMVGIFVVIALIVFQNLNGGVDWKLVLFRMSAALILAFPAWYAAHESARHRANEIRNRRIELELASIDPYMEKLPEETRTELKSKLTEKFFGMNESEEKAEELPKNFIELLKVLIQKIPGK